MKKILLANSFYFPTVIGGAEIFTQLLAEGLTEEYDVHVLTTANHSETVVKERINNVTVHRLPLSNIYWPGNDIKDRSSFSKMKWHVNNLYSRKQYTYIKEILKDVSPDIIHSQNLMGIGTYLWSIANKLNIPVVHTTHDYQLMEPVNQRLLNVIFSLINKRRSKTVSIALGVSKFTINKHLQQNYFKTAEVDAIPNIVNSESFDRRYRKSKQPLIIGYIGQLEKIKGVNLLFDLLKEFDSTIIEKLIVCGAGSMEKEIIEQGKKDNRLVYKSHLASRAVQETMAQLDVVLVPSIWEEPFGRVLIESYNQGTPIIASRVGGIPDIVYSEEWLFKKNDLKELKFLVDKFYNLEDGQIKQEINKSYEQSKLYEDNIPQHINIYDKLIEKV
ncbi:glycosyltransferase [Priestia megaterium]|uniref:glycosyltransferase n=1 Tax=Priestia megaterium TaxID=1404 RepID=UPI0018849022|nr:glycosyltransferase [Priestia megaterium]